MESRVNSYGATLQKTLVRAEGEYLFARDGRRYFDLFSSAGVANFGHNHPFIKEGLCRYIQGDGLVHALDYHTEPKEQFIASFERIALPPEARGRYRYYFSAPAGTLAIEAALKYARKATGRRMIGCFTNSFHGLTHNALSITGNLMKRGSAYADLGAVARLPYQGYLGVELRYSELYAKMFDDPSGGVGLPGGVVLETIQAEGGIHCCDSDWYHDLLDLCAARGIPVILDDVQVGCGRTGTFFSAQRLGDRLPDIICMAKGLSGFGLPIAVVLLDQALDVLDPGENSGTFRGNNLGVHAATLMLELYSSAECQALIADNERRLTAFMAGVARDHTVRGRGLIYGIDLGLQDRARLLQSRLMEEGVLVERCGGAPGVVKVMPPLTSRPDELDRALDVLGTQLQRLG